MMQLKKLIQNIKTELKGKSTINHNHDSVYSKLGHTHSYASTSHTHDDRYYTESEINNKLDGHKPFWLDGQFFEMYFNACNYFPGNVDSFCNIIDFNNGWRIMFLTDYILYSASSHYVASKYFEYNGAPLNNELSYKCNLPFSFLNDQYIVVGTANHGMDYILAVDTYNYDTNQFYFSFTGANTANDKYMNLGSLLNEGHRSITKMNFILYGKR